VRIDNNREQALWSVQEYCTRLKTNRSVVGELIEDRKAEAMREYGDQAHATANEVVRLSCDPITS
jgi:hypothetical protein